MQDCRLDHRLWKSNIQFFDHSLENFQSLGIFSQSSRNFADEISTSVQTVEANAN